MQLNLKTLYVGDHADSFDFLAPLMMEKCYATVIYVDDHIEANVLSLRFPSC